MPVSTGLQKYFDSKRSKKGDMQQKFAAISQQIDPAFMKSFEVFHDKIMGIVEENPEASEMLWEELSELDMELQNSNRTHDLKKAAAIIEVAE